MSTINAKDLVPETIESLDGSESFVMFDSVEGKQGPIDIVSDYVVQHGKVIDNKTTLELINEIYDNLPGDDIAYVSPSGSDTTGVGTLSEPYMTVNKALESGATKVMVAEGVYEQQIDLALSDRDNICIIAGTYDKRPLFVHPESFIADEETKEYGFTRVYSCQYNGVIDKVVRLYEENAPDVSTQIENAERDPYERGQVYRELDTKILPCTATNKSDALTEIETSEEYKYYFDTQNHIVYFSRPLEVSSNTPLRKSVNARLFVNGESRAKTITMIGVCVKYMMVNTVMNSNCTYIDCKAANVYGAGCFFHDSPLSVTYIGCEADGAYRTATTGDGFNGSSHLTGDPFAKQATVRLIDCWSHDNNDDGESNHARFETVIYGGLYEYNHKGGVTPSYGDHCACYGVISRNNYNGFLYTGEAAQDEGGKYGQMRCVDCVAMNNSGEGSGVGVGFYVRGAGNSQTLINCKSIGNLTGVRSDAGTRTDAIDLGVANNGTDKVVPSSATINIINTERLEA